MTNNISIVKKEECCGCSSCMNACPVGAIAMTADNEGFLYPHISDDKCIHCGICLNKCPSCSPQNQKTLRKAFAAYAKDENEHMASSSGGIFAVFAKYFLERNGYICGASFNEKQHLRHLLSANADDLKTIRETKYVQSEIGTVYQEIKALLDNGKEVLFCGTPCQAAGLDAYLGKDYENLLAVDLICHGVPSPQVFAEYLKEISRDSKVIRMTFRDKSEGMSQTYLNYWLESGDIVREAYGESSYIKGFLQNMTVRPSCFMCKFKGIDRSSDITIGDFWGLNDFCPDMISELGTSAVLIHSEKGYSWFQKILNRLNYAEVKPEEVAFWNTCLTESVKTSPDRNKFFQEYRQHSVTETVKKYYTEPIQKKTADTLFRRVKRKVRNAISTAGGKKQP